MLDASVTQIDALVSSFKRKEHPQTLNPLRNRKGTNSKEPTTSKEPQRLTVPNEVSSEDSRDLDN